MTEPAAQIRIYPDGPILVRGEVELIDADGSVVRSRRKVVAICRCGHSGLTPWCDGTHKVVRRFQPDSRGGRE